MSSRVDILLADDHAIVRKGLKLSIEENKRFRIVAEAGDGETALALIRKHRPLIAILDIDMPKLGGLNVARAVSKEKLNTRIIFLTLHSSQELLSAAIDAGALGYVLKNSALAEIAVGVEAVAEGRSFYSSALVEPMLRPREPGMPAQAESLISRLTLTERRIIRMVADGKSSKEIGAELLIHYRTVQNHRTNIAASLILKVKARTLFCALSCRIETICDESSKPENQVF